MAVAKLSIGVLCGMLTFRAGAQAEPPPFSAYRYVLPLELALEVATEAVRVCGLNGYGVTATVVNMDGISQVVLRGDGATVHTGQSSYEKAFTVVTLGPEFGLDTSGALFELVKTSPYAPQSRPPGMRRRRFKGAQLAWPASKRAARRRSRV